MYAPTQSPLASTSQMTFLKISAVNGELPATVERTNSVSGTLVKPLFWINSLEFSPGEPKAIN